MIRKMIWVLAALALLAGGSAGTARAQEETPQQNPVAAYLAGLTGMSYEEVVELQKDGNGLGNIGRAYLFSEATGMDLLVVLQLAKEQGWGNLYKEAGLHPGGNGLGSLVHGNIGKGNGNGNGPDKEPGPPAWANGGKDK